MWFVEHMFWCSYFHINIVLCQYARLSCQGPTGTTQSTLIERRDQIDCHDVSVLQLQWTSRPQRHIRNTLFFLGLHPTIGLIAMQIWRVQWTFVLWMCRLVNV